MVERHYSVHQLAELSGVSVRTLHHYDQIGLLEPARRGNGYRSYDSHDVARLQQILLYRACGMGLAQIRSILDDPRFDERVALEGHLASLRAQRQKIDEIIRTVERTLAARDKETQMDDAARFEGLRRKTVARNEQTYGSEARARYGDAAVDAANGALLAMDEKDWNDMNALEERIKGLLSAARATGDPTGPEAVALVDAHAHWLSMHWGDGAYSAEAHRGLADGYLADERFIAYYDGACGAGATQFLHDAIHALR